MHDDRSEAERALEASYWEATRDWDLMDLSLGAALGAVAAACPDRCALVEILPSGEPGRRWTYAELYDWSRRTAQALLTRFAPGERIAVCADNVAEWIPLLYGAALGGFVLVTINPACRPREIRHVLEKSGAAALFAVRRYRDNAILETVQDMRADLPALREVYLIENFDAFVGTAVDPALELPEVAPLDPCLILFTSGTTGSPKGVMLHHKGVLNMAHMTHYRGGLRDGGVFVSPMPLFYVGGLAHAGIGAVAHRSTHVVLPHWDAGLYMEAVARERGTYSLLVPTMIEAVLAHPERDRHDLSSLTCLISGASLVEEQLIRRVQDELGSSLVNVYGQTEMHGVCITTRRDDPMDKRLTTLGRPIPHFDVKIADPATGETVPLGEEGEIWVRSFQNMLGYVGQPEETARTITPDGWLRSGDLARMDEQGFIAITGRIKEMIIRGGENIYPREVETVLGDHPDIAGIAVLGVPDPFYGEQVAAVIIPREGRDPDPIALRAYARELMMPFKVPSRWAFVDAFPFTDTGKLQKFKLRELIVSGELPVIDTASPRAVARQA